MVTPPPRLSDFFLHLLRRFPGQFALIAAILLTTTLLALRVSGVEPADVPRSLLAAMLHAESSSYYREDGTIRYVNMRRGSAGERGPFQCLPSTARQFGFSPSLVEADPAYAEHCARTILAHYFTVCQDWKECAAAWRKGLGGRNTSTARAYAERVYNNEN